jgi:5-methylcytosine-specific restriction endonuclease McrA
MDAVEVLGRSCLGPVEPGTCHHCGGHAKRGERCCSTECRRAWSEGHTWTAARQAAIARAGFACEACGALDYDTVLHVHHDPPLESSALHGKPGCHQHPERLHVLCPECHYRAHLWLRAKPGEQLRLIVTAA